MGYHAQRLRATPSPWGYYEYITGQSEHRPLRERRCGAGELGARGDRAEERAAAEDERLQAVG